MSFLQRLFSRRWLGGTVLVLVAIGLFVRLGIWQLDRLDQRRAANEALRAVLDAPPLDLAEPLPAAPDVLENRLATVTGQYDFANERVVLLQTWQGQPGVQLLTPLLIEEMAGDSAQSGGETAVLVQLDQPVVNQIPPGIRSQLDLVLRLGVAFAAGIGLALLVEYLDPTLRDREEVARLGLEILGEIPKQ